MKNLSQFILGIESIETKNSPVNGKLEVVRDTTWGSYIKGGGLTQSGGVAEKVWTASLLDVKKNYPEIKNALILGLGGGSIAKIISEHWRGAKISGVDIDPVIVELGRRYLGMDKLQVEITIGDALLEVGKFKSKKKKFDLVCIDTYIKDSFPDKFTNRSFLEDIDAILEKEGVAVFNRLYYGDKRKLAESFSEGLSEIFDVKRIYTEANIMFICSR